MRNWKRSRQQIGEERFAEGKFEAARELFDKITTDDEFVEFLTLPGYDDSIED